MSKPIHLTSEEITARTVYCHECHAPAGAACQTIRWTDDKHPLPTARSYHSRRLKFAKKQAGKKESL